MSVHAKHYAAMAALAALAGGCADLGLQRFAPPGIIKYEDLAKDQPPNPAIVERVELVKAGSDGRFPNLSEQPQETPTATPPEEREAEMAALRDARDALETAVAAERLASSDERGRGVTLPGDKEAAERSLDEAAAALAEAVARADEAARRERDLPPRPATPDNQ